MEAYILGKLQYQQVIIILLINAIHEMEIINIIITTIITILAQVLKISATVVEMIVVEKIHLTR